MLKRCGGPFTFFDHFSRFCDQNVAGFVAEKGDFVRVFVGGEGSLVGRQAEKLIGAVERPEDFFQAV